MAAFPSLRHETDAKDRFDRWSESGTYQRLRPWLAYVQGRVLDRIDWTRSRRILDAACGSGWAVHEAARRLPDAQGVLACGSDISRGMLRQQQREGGAAPRAALLAASAQRLPYRSASFDAALCTAAFHHFPIPEEALAELRRVLRPGGLLLIADTCRDQSAGTWVWDRLHRWFEKGHVKYYRTDELRSLVRAAGFEAVEIADVRPAYADTRKLIGAFALLTATAPAGSGAA